MKPMQYTITPKFCRKAEKDWGHRSAMTKLMRNLMKPKLALKRNSQSYMIMTMKAAAMENRPSEEILVVIDSVSRLVPGVLNNDESAQTESFSDGLLEYPQYTRPANYKGMEVPEVLLSGHHGNIEKWRHEKSLERTKKYRPDLYEKYMAENNNNS